MTADIFPGLAEPKSQLMKDIQDMIDKNGGLLPLARRIESEQTKIFRIRANKEKKPPKTDRRLYSEYEDRIILSNLSKAEKLCKVNRTWKSIHSRLTKILGPVKNRTHENK